MPSGPRKAGGMNFPMNYPGVLMHTSRISIFLAGAALIALTAPSFAASKKAPPPPPQDPRIGVLEQQLRDRTFKEGQDSRRGQRGQRGDQPKMGDLQQDQQGLRDRLQQLLPGASPGLDTICEGILSKAPFVLRDRHVRLKPNATEERRGVEDALARAHQPASGG